ncbi:hypothetical protein [Micromonospora okii]|uniref:hypothetical protein n=1 Tax=Micromonospora okii TaxID=1182970 RepID=UPI001E2E8444|nr:hypothetical protein [Micromonospora okii]
MPSPVEAADRRLRGDGPDEVHLAASHRVLRAQRFGAGLQTHFRLFALVSSARDAGSGRTEARLLTLHLDYWQRVLARLVPHAAPRLRFTVLDSPVLRDRLADTVLPALAAGGVPILEEPDRTRGRGYYVDAALGLAATSCVSVHRLAALATR